MRPSDLDIWILAGQSNMQGAGLLEGHLAPHEQVYSFTSAGQWEAASEPLHRLWESFTPVHANFMRAGMSAEDNAKPDAHYAEQDNRNRYSGAGLGIAFGAEMAGATGRALGLVPAAHGGTSLAQWDHKLADQHGASLYGAMIERAERALQGGGTLRGILWYQGESDANEADSKTYQQRFTAWIAAARHDLGAPELPVLMVQIGRVTREPGEPAAEGWQNLAWETVRQALLDIPKSVPHTATVPTVDLGLVDTIHIDTPGLIRLGHRLARVAQGKGTPAVVRIEKAATLNPLPTVRLVCENVSGGWTPRFHIGGFEVRDANANVHPKIYILNVDADPSDPNNFLATLSAPLEAGVGIGYGYGLNPYCNAVDEADMALPAFKAIGMS